MSSAKKIICMGILFVFLATCLISNAIATETTKEGAGIGGKYGNYYLDLGDYHWVKIPGLEKTVYAKKVWIEFEIKFDVPFEKDDVGIDLFQVENAFDSRVTGTNRYGFTAQAWVYKISPVFKGITNIFRKEKLPNYYPAEPSQINFKWTAVKLNSAPEWKTDSQGKIGTITWTYFNYGQDIVGFTSGINLKDEIIDENPNTIRFEIVSQSNPDLICIPSNYENSNAAINENKEDSIFCALENPKKEWNYLTNTLIIKAVDEYHKESKETKTVDVIIDNTFFPPSEGTAIKISPEETNEAIENSRKELQPTYGIAYGIGHTDIDTSKLNNYTTTVVPLW